MTQWPELVVSVASLRQRDNLADLKRRTPDETSVQVQATVLGQGMAITTSRIPDGEPIIVDVSLTADHRGVTARGTIASAWEGECRRCLEMVREDVTIDLHVTFLSDVDFDAHEPGPDEVDAYAFSGEMVDVGEVVREELMLSLPLSPLCRDGCEGVEGEFFSTGEGDPASEESGDPPIDPRWAALSELSFDED